MVTGMKLTNVVLVEGDYNTLEELAKITNGLWNKAVHLEKEKLKEGKFAFYSELCRALKDDPLYRLLPSQTAQAVLQKLDGAIRSYIKLRKNDPRARIPSYHKPKTAWIVPYKSQQIKCEDDALKLTLSEAYRKEKGLRWLTLKTYGRQHDGETKYLELYPRGGRWFASRVVEVKEPPLTETNGEISVDLGIVNLVATWNGEDAEIYKGGAVNSVLRYRNKGQAKLQETLATHGEKTSQKRRELCRRTTAQAKHAIHSLTETLVEKALNERKGIVAGDLTGILDQGRGRANQKLHQWMYRLMLSQLGYKCRLAGVPFRTKSERNTSRTCVACRVRHRGGRIHRGLFRCKLGWQYNADAGAAFNIGGNVSPIPVSGVGVVGKLACPVVVRWNGHWWLSSDEANPSNRKEPHTL
jgi:putative transposase